MYNWKTEGKIRLKSLDDKIVETFDSLPQAIQKLGHTFVQELQNENIEKYISSKSLPWLCQSVHHSSLVINKKVFPNFPYTLLFYYLQSRGCFHYLEDENNLIVPKAVLNDIASRFHDHKTKKNRLGFEYDPEKDFRNGPLRGYGTGWKLSKKKTYKKNGGKKAYLRSLLERTVEINDDDDDEEIFVKINMNLYRDPNTWDDFPPTRRGRSWKRYRQTQYKPVKKF